MNAGVSSDAAGRWRRVAELFDTLVELDPEARESRLTSLASTDAALAAEVRRLLDSDAREESTLDGDWRAALTGASPASAESETDLPEPGDRSGECIDAYRLLRRVGRGGMGEVYLAERSGGDFVQRVALKLLRRGVDTEDVIRRFVRERSILARLEHPGIARLIDGGMSEDGLPWLVMEYVEGEPLMDYVGAHALDLDARLELLASVCDAVDFAHRHLVVHRDLKPSNVLVNSEGRVKLLDFGIAKLLEADESAEILTGTGMRVLSPAYAAPEQFLGESITTATDVYALGVLMFQMLTGALPHIRGARSLDALAREVTEETTERPSAVIRRQSGSGTERRATHLEGDLDTIVLTALQREPSRRYASAAALAHDLRAFLEGRPIAARADSLSYRASKFVRRNRLVVASAALVLVAILAGLGLALWQAGVARAEAQRADREAAIARTAARRAVDEAELAERTRAFVVRLFTEADPLKTRAGSKLTAEDFIKSGLARVDTELADAPAARSELRVAFASGLQGLGNYQAAIEPLERSRAEFRERYGRESSDEANTLNLLAVAQMRLDNATEAARLANESVAMFRRLPGDYRKEMIQSRTVAGNAALSLGDAEGALAIHRANLADRRALFGANAVQTAVDHNNISASLTKLDRFVESERESREVLALLRSDPDSPRARQAWALSGIGFGLYGQGRYAEAEAVFLEEQALLAELLPPENAMQGNPLSGLARVRIAQGRMEDAYALFQRARGLYRMAGDIDEPRDAVAWGFGLIEEGRDSEAERKLGEATSAFAAAGRKPTTESLKAGAGHGLALARLHRVNEGLAESRASMAGFDSRRTLHRGVAYAEALLAHTQTLDLAGKADEAAQGRTLAFATLEKTLGPDHPSVKRLQAK